MMPYIIQFNKKFTDKYADIDKLLGVDDFPEYIKALNIEQSIPLTLREIKELEVTEEKFNNVLDIMSENAHKDPCTLTNPCDPSIEDVRMIYKAAFYGRKV